MPTYKPAVYKSSGGDQLTVASSGVLELESGATLSLDGQAITTTGGIAGSSGTFTADIALTSGISASTGVFTGGVNLSSTLTAVHGTFSSSITAGGNITITSGLNASTGTFTADLSVSSGIAGLKATLTSGITATTGNFSGGIAMSSGISGTTGGFSSGVSALNITASSAITATAGRITGSMGYVGYVETATTSYTSITNYGLSIIKSTNASAFVAALPAPVAGLEKYIVSITPAGSTPGVPIITSSGASASVNSNTSILFSSGIAADPEWIHLIGQNSTNWLVLGYSTDVSLSTT